MIQTISAVIIAIVASAPLAHDTDQTDVGPGQNAFTALGQHSQQGSDPKLESAPTVHPASQSGPVVRYELRSACSAGVNDGDPHCPTNNCPPGQEIYRL